MGRGVLRHHQHRHLRARTRGLRLHPRGRGRRLLRRRVPRAARRGPARCTATSSTATGRTSARSRRTSARTPTCSTAGSSVEIDGFQLGDGRLARRRTSRSTPRPAIDGPVVIGDNCRVEAGAHLRQYTVLGTDVIVKADAFLERAVCHDHVYVGPGTNLRGCVIGRNTDLRAHVRVEEGVVVGDECFVGEHAVINPNVKIYPFKTVEAGAVVTSSIVWESRGARTLFGRRGVRGPRQRRHHPRGRRARRDGVRHLAAEGVHDHAPAATRAASPARSSARSSAGSTSSGVNVEDIELATVPLTRFQVRNGPSQGGITVRLAPGDPDTVEIRFFDSRRPRYRRRRCSARSSACSTARTTGARSAATSATSSSRPAPSSSTPPRSSASSTSTGCVGTAFKVVLDYSFGAASIVMPTVLAKLGAEVLAVNPFASTHGVTTDTGDTQCAAGRRARPRVRQRSRLRRRSRRRARHRDRRHRPDPGARGAAPGHLLAARRRRPRRTRRGAGQRDERGRADPGRGRGGAHEAGGREPHGGRGLST